MNLQSYTNLYKYPNKWYEYFGHPNHTDVSHTCSYTIFKSKQNSEELAISNDSYEITTKEMKNGTSGVLCSPHVLGRCQFYTEL